jgi:hypothetical protein
LGPFSSGVAFVPELLDLDDIAARLVSRWKTPLLPWLPKLAVVCCAKSIGILQLIEVSVWSSGVICRVADRCV